MDFKSIEQLDKIISDEVTKGEKFIVSSSGDLPLYGYLIAYSLGKCYIPHSDAEIIFTSRGLNIPHTISSDALKRAIATHDEKETTETTQNGELIKTIRRITPSGRVGDKYYYDISLHMIQTSKQIKHINLAQVVFTLSRTAITEYVIDIDGEIVKGIPETDIPILRGLHLSEIHQEIEQLVNSIMETYLLQMTHINNDAIRDSITKYIKSHDGIPFVIGRGGAWFVPIMHKNFVKTVRDALKDAQKYATGNFDVRIIPVLKDDDLKMAIKLDIEDYAKSQFQSLLKSVYQKISQAEDESEIEKIINDASEDKLNIIGLAERYKTLLEMEITINTDEIQLETPNNPLLTERFQAMLQSLRSVTK